MKTTEIIKEIKIKEQQLIEVFNTMPQKEAAQKFNLDVAQVSRFVNGKAGWSYTKILRLAEKAGL